MPLSVGCMHLLHILLDRHSLEVDQKEIIRAKMTMTMYLMTIILYFVSLASIASIR
jgi:hypothetical protein